MVDARQSIEHLRHLNRRFGPRVPVWRYDTIIFSSLTTIDFHRHNFAHIAGELAGITDEVIISFAQIYRKSRRDTDTASKTAGFFWEDPPGEAKFELAGEFAEIARQHGIQLSMCAQKEFLATGVVEARCIDARRLADAAGKPIVAKIKGNRPDCACYRSRDIGEYDTCPHGCVYCYAVRNQELTLRRFRAHDPEGEFLFTPAGTDAEDDDQSNEHPKQRRLL